MGATWGSCNDAAYSAFFEDEFTTTSDIPKDLNLTLRVDASPIRSSLGTVMHEFMLTDEFKVERIESVPEWGPLSWRHERFVQEHDRKTNSEPMKGAFAWPGGPRSGVRYRCLRAKVGKRWVMLLTAVQREFRTMERVLEGIEDAKSSASYAHSFNAHLMRANGKENAEETQGPSVKVCVPIACRCLTSSVPQFAHPGSVMMVLPYTAPEVKKFVFDGSEDFHEVPHSFFHYVAWMSGGAELLFDLQGVEDDDGNIVLVDTVVLRTLKSTYDEMAEIVLPVVDLQSADDKNASRPSEPQFEALHPKCSQLCRGFDPQRRGMKLRRVCGMEMPKCGLAN